MTDMIYDLGKPETNFMKKSFSYSAAVVHPFWNDLSITAKEKGISLNKFALDSIW
jgi:hypothetical protein